MATLTAHVLETRTSVTARSLLTPLLDVALLGKYTLICFSKLSDLEMAEHSF